MSPNFRDTCLVCVVSEGEYMCLLPCQHTIHAACLGEIVQTGYAHARCPRCGEKLARSTKIEFGDGKYWKVNTNELLRNFHDRGTAAFNVSDSIPSTTTMHCRSEQEIYPDESISVLNTTPHGESRRAIARKPVSDADRQLEGPALTRSNVKRLEFENATAGISAWLDGSQSNVSTPEMARQASRVVREASAVQNARTATDVSLSRLSLYRDASTLPASPPTERLAIPATSSGSRFMELRAALKSAGRGLIHELCKPSISEAKECSNLDRAAVAPQEIMGQMTSFRDSGSSRRASSRPIGPSRLMVSTITFDEDTGEVIKYKMERKARTANFNNFASA